MKKRAIVLAGLLALAAGAYASERAANAYKTHKLATNAVMVSCNDEREPVVKKLENGPFVIITCHTSQPAQ
jgi:hypothetical protein